MKKTALLFAVILVPLDFLMLFCAGLSAYFLRTSTLVAQYRPVLFHLNLPLERFMLILVFLIPFWLVIFALTGLYRMKRGDAFREFFQVVAAVSFAMMSVIIYIFIQREWFDSRFIVLAVWLFAILYVFVGRLVLRGIERYMTARHHFGVHRAIIVGSNAVSNVLAREIGRNPSLGYRVVEQMAALDLGAIERAIGEKNIDTVFVGQADYTEESVVELAEFCRDRHLHFHFAPTLFQTLTTNVDVDVIGGIPFIEVRHTALDGWGRVLKRIFDFAVAFIGLVVLSPLFAVIALLVKLDSPGPVFVPLERVTLGRRFAMYKFRSMVDNAHAMKAQLAEYNERKDSGPLFKMHNDPRITLFGRFLRKYRLDELPQLMNVVLGEMSLVGPRPHEPEEIAHYERHHKKLLVMRAGITGMAQISGSSDLPFEEEVKLDTYYIENWSFALDIKILFRTLLLLVYDRSAC